MLLTNHHKGLQTVLFHTAIWLMAVLGALTLLYSVFWFSWLTVLQALVCCVGASFLFFYWRTLQQDLQTRNAELQRLLQTMNEGFIIADEDETFLYVNDKFCEITGYPREALLDRRNEEVFCYDDASLETLRQQRALRIQNQRSTYEVHTKRKDGSPLVLQVSAIPKVDEKANFCGAICVTTDITERKAAEAALMAERARLSQWVEERTASLQAATHALEQELAERNQIENALRAAEEEYRALFDNVPLGLYRSTLAGRQLRANPALVALNGYATEEEMVAAIGDIGREWYVDPDRRRDFQQILEEQGSVSNFESEIYRHKTRERIWISESAILVRDVQGQPLYYQGTVQEITERKEVEEEQARLITQFAKVARLKDEFLASMSHELRTPLNSILGMTEALQDQVYGDVTPRQRKALTAIDASGRHLLSLINDILDLAKIESGQAELSYSTVDVEALCQSTLRLVQPTAEKKRITLTATLDPAVKTMPADGRRLKQILLNLLSNAVKFTPDAGAIKLEICGQQTAEPVVQFVVSDTGVGIPQEAIVHLFQPFIQVDSSLSRQYDGTGLGLALVYRMVEMHGGTVTVDSEIGQGSRFTVTLPWRTTGELSPDSDDESLRVLLGGNDVAAKADRAELTTSPATPTLGPARLAETRRLPLILLAEDNPITVKAVSDFLRYKGYQVETASNGAQALTMAQTLHPALILMDMQMPSMDGLEATRRLRADQMLAAIPVIAFTAMAMPNDQARCTAAGVDAYLSKPVSLSHLQSTIERFLPVDAA
jgi:PAS domain S-box-containing protein